MERSITKIDKVRRNEIKEVITPFDKSKTSILPTSYSGNPSSPCLKAFLSPEFIAKNRV
jgi:hypothetical protein